MCLVPSVLITIGFEDTKAKVTDLAEMYKEDLPPQGSIQLQSELHCWYVKWRKQRDTFGQACLPMTPTLALPHATAMFPNINIIITPYFVYSTSYFLLIRAFVQWFKEDQNSIKI